MKVKLDLIVLPCFWSHERIKNEWPTRIKNKNRSRVTSFSSLATLTSLQSTRPSGQPKFPLTDPGATACSETDRWDPDIKLFSPRSCLLWVCDMWDRIVIPFFYLRFEAKGKWPYPFSLIDFGAWWPSQPYELTSLLSYKFMYSENTSRKINLKIAHHGPMDLFLEISLVPGPSVTPRCISDRNHAKSTFPQRTVWKISEDRLVPCAVRSASGADRPPVENHKNAKVSGSVKCMPKAHLQKCLVASSG
jgi:hypothetical protein